MKTRIIYDVLICTTMIISIFAFTQLVSNWQIGNEERFLKKQFQEKLQDRSSSTEDEAIVDDDFYGFLVFEELHMNEMIMHGSDNVYYLDHLPDGTVSEKGTLFIDCENGNEDMNTVLYGHHVFYENTRLTPLLSLMDQDAYDHAHRFKIITPKEKVVYDIISINIFDGAVDHDIDYRVKNFDQKGFDDYRAWLKKGNLIVSKEELSFQDRFLTIQTCYEREGRKRVIFTCRRVKEKEDMRDC